MDRYNYLYGVKGKDYGGIARATGLNSFIQLKLGAQNADLVIEKTNEFLGDFRLTEAMMSEYKMQREIPLNVRYAPMHLYKLDKFPNSMKSFAAISVKGLEPKETENPNMEVVERRETYYRYLTFISKDLFCSDMNGYSYLDQIFGSKLLSFVELDEYKKGNSFVAINSNEPDKCNKDNVEPIALRQDWNVISLVVTALYQNPQTRIVIKLKPTDNIMRRGMDLLQKIYSVIPPYMAFETGFSLYEDPESIKKLVSKLNTRIFVLSGYTSINVKKHFPSSTVLIDLDKDIPSNFDSDFVEAVAFWGAMNWKERSQGMQAAMCSPIDYFKKAYYESATNAFKNNPVFSYIDSNYQIADTEDPIAFVTSIIALYNDYMDKYRPAVEAEWIENDYKVRFVSNLPEFVGIPEALTAISGYSKITGLKYRLIKIRNNFLKDDSLKDNAKYIDILFNWIGSIWKNPMEDKAIENQLIAEDVAELHADEIAKEKAAHAEDVKNEQDKYAADMAEEKQAHADDVKREQDKYAADMAEEKQAHAADVKREQDKYAADMEVERTAHAADVKREQDKYAADMAEEKQAHAADVKRELDKYTADMAEEKQAHAADVKREQDKYAADMAQKESDYRDAEAKLKQSHQQTIEQLNITHEKTLKERDNKHSAEVNKLNSEKTTILNEAKKEISDRDAKIVNLDGKIAELSSDKALLTSQKKANETEIKRLKGLVAVNTESLLTENASLKKDKKVQEEKHRIDKDDWKNKEEELQKSKKSLKIVIGVFAALAVVAGAGAGYFGFSSMQEKQNASQLGQTVYENETEIHELNTTIEAQNVTIADQQETIADIDGELHATLFATQPESASIAIGQPVTFTAQAISPEATYIWQKKGADGIWVTVPEVTSGTYTFTAADGMDQTSYRCIVIDENHLAQSSNEVVLTIAVAQSTTEMPSTEETQILSTEQAAETNTTVE